VGRADIFVQKFKKKFLKMGLAFLAGVLASVILIPLNKLIASKIGKYSNEMMSVKDARLKLGKIKKKFF